MHLGDEKRDWFANPLTHEERLQHMFDYFKVKPDDHPFGTQANLRTLELLSALVEEGLLPRLIIHRGLTNCYLRDPDGRAAVDFTGWSHHGYYISYRYYPRLEAPWPDTRVVGYTTEVHGAVEMIKEALRRTDRAWDSNPERG